MDGVSILEFRALANGVANGAGLVDEIVVARERLVWI